MTNGLAMGTYMLRGSEKDVDFFINKLYAINFFGSEVYITTTHVCTAIVILAIMVLAIAARRSVLKNKDNPTKFSAGVEMAIGALLSFVDSAMGKAGKRYINYMGTILVFIFLSNISGLFGLRPPTADFGTTLFMALVTFTMIQYAAIRYQKFGAVKSLFEPVFIFFPINVISELATPVSLSLRLFGNMLAGTVIMALYYGMLPLFMKLGIPAALHFYFDLFSGVIQTYVFVMLSMTFIFDKRNVEA